MSPEKKKETEPSTKMADVMSEEKRGGRRTSDKEKPEGPKKESSDENETCHG